MSLTIETEELLREKAQLKKMLQTLEDEEKYLGQRLRIVEEKLEIRELKENIRVKRAAVEQLKSTIRKLEERLNEPRKTPEPSQIPKEPQEKEPLEVMVKAAPIDSQQSENEQEKKRHRFFP